MLFLFFFSYCYYCFCHTPPFFFSRRDLSQPKCLSTKGITISLSSGQIFWNLQWAFCACYQLLLHFHAVQIVIQSFPLSPLPGSYSEVCKNPHITGRLASFLSLAHPSISVLYLQVDSSFP